MSTGGSQVLAVVVAEPRSTDGAFWRAAAVVLLVLGGGFLAADRLATASAGLSTGASETTVEKVVTVREHGKTIVKRVLVVRRVSQTLRRHASDHDPGRRPDRRAERRAHVPVIKRRE